MKNIFFSLILIMLCVGTSAQGIKISELPAGTTPTGSEVMPMVQGGVTKKVTVTQIANAVGSLVGVTGATGATGAAGATGPTGAAGATGSAGATGPTGSAGATGATGPVDTTGFWNIYGNSGTTPGTNFIGTTDNKDLIFKVAGVFSGQIDTGTGNTSLGMRALYSLTSGSANTAFGASALQNVTSGRENVAFGATALQSITTTRRNTAVGLCAGCQLTSGDRNTFLGFNAGQNLTSGGSNVFLGNKSGDQITNADRCVFVGDSARGTTTGLVNAIAIGYNAYVDTSNAMVLGNGVNVGIGINKPTAKLHVVGNFKYVDGNQSNNSILKSDANGVASWATISVLLATLPEYADDAAAATGGVPVGGAYYNTTIHAYTKRES